MFTSSVVLLLLSVKTHRLSTKSGISRARDLPSTDTEAGRAAWGLQAPPRRSECEREHRTLQGVQRNPCTCRPQETAGGGETPTPLTERTTNECARSNGSRNRCAPHAGLPAAGSLQVWMCTHDREPAPQHAGLMAAHSPSCGPFLPTCSPASKPGA